MNPASDKAAIISEFEWTAEHQDLGASVRRLMVKRAPLARSRELCEGGQGHDQAVWSELARTGIVSMTAPEPVGGGGSEIELAIVAEEFGKVLFGGPFLSSSVLALHALLASDGDRAVSGVASGEQLAALAVVEADGRWSPESIRTSAEEIDGRPMITGTKSLVLGGADADVLVVAAVEPPGVSLFVVEGAAGVTRVPLTPLDLTRPVARVEFDRTPSRRIGRPGRGWEAVERALQVGRVYLAAEAVGASETAVGVTAEYARTRRQFGRPIGTFQGVKHRLADMAVRTEMARSAARYAAWKAGTGQASDAAVAIAASYCSESFLQTAKDMIQLHGGIGFTWEHDAHFFLRRARATYSLLGTPRQHEQTLLAALRTEAAL